VATDVARLAGAVDGVNLKLAKCGGLREALAIVAAARAHDLRVMAGCMIETSLGITAAAHLAPLLDYADLDGAALLADDPFEGATIAGGTIGLPDRPGLGVVARAGRGGSGDAPSSGAAPGAGDAPGAGGPPPRSIYVGGTD
jgi:L-alanine-DL-glutamate epimerase-like enolase superfamily enzyme